MLEKIRNSLIRFMYGRNGADQLNRALLVVYLAVWLLSSILGWLHLDLISQLVSFLQLALSVLLIWRTLSKNLPKRRAENQKFLNFLWKIKSRRQDPDHKYFTCKSCGTVCRVPAGKGNIVITCPKCRNEIRAKT